MRRSSLVLVLGCVAALATAASPAPAIGEFPGPQAWASAARTGDPLRVPTPAGVVEVVVAESPILTTHARAVAQGIVPLRGRVVGDPSGVVRVTLSHDALSGWIRTRDRSYDVNTARDGTVVVTAPTATGKLIDTGMPTDHAGGCLSLTPHRLAAATGLLNGFAPLELDLAVVADQTYREANGEDWIADAVTVVNSAAAIYSQLNIALRVVDIHGDAFEQGGSSALIAETRTHYRTTHELLDRDVVALLVHKPIGPLGQASCIGGAGQDEGAYLVMDTDINPITFLGITAYSNIHGKTLAHEIGHLLNAHHHYSNCHEASRDPVVDVCTLMTPYVDLLDERVGSLEKLVMRGWAEEYLADE